jgi:hypothetical protein
MILNLAAALSISLVIGSAVALLVCPRIGTKFAYLLLVLSLGIGSGLAISSLLLFLLLVATNGNGRGVPILAGVLAVVLMGAAAMRWRRERSPGTRSADSSRIVPWLAIGFCLASLAAALAFGEFSLHRPHGEWDAWSDWNRHARFMFRGGEHWRDVCSAAEAPFTPGYPMLTPGAIAFCWFFLGKETLLASSAVGFLFTVAVVALLVSSLLLLRSASQGLFAGIVLLCSPLFIYEATKQYADVPLASYYLGAVLLLCLHDKVRGQPGWLVMAGMMTGMAVWTKPEGLLFALVLVLVRCVVIGGSRGVRAWKREFLPFALGLLPFLAVMLYFKLRMVGAPSDLLVGQTPRMFLGRLLSGYRYVTVVKAFGKQILYFGGWFVKLPPMLLMYLFVVGINRAREDRPAIYTASLTLILMMCGYFMVYILTPHDLVWHLDTSLSRLLIQLWPLTIFIFFLLARTPEEVARELHVPINAGLEYRSSPEEPAYLTVSALGTLKRQD